MACASDYNLYISPGRAVPRRKSDMPAVKNTQNNELLCVEKASAAIISMLNPLFALQDRGSLHVNLMLPLKSRSPAAVELR